MSSILLKINSLTKRFGGFVATDGLSLNIMAGEVHSIIGPNGAGKTTLASQITGIARPDGGSIEFDGKDITHASVAERARLGLARTFQIGSIFGEFTAMDNLSLAFQARQGHFFRFWRPACDDRPSRDAAAEMLEKLGLAERGNVLGAELSYGEQRVLELGLALAAAPKLLVLDEPLAGMGPTEAARILQLLETLRLSYTMILIEHDMQAVFRLSDTISVIEYGRLIASGDGDAIRNNVEVRRAYLGNEAG